MRTLWQTLFTCYSRFIVRHILNISQQVRIMILTKLLFKKVEKDLQKHPASFWSTTEYILRRHTDEASKLEDIDDCKQDEIPIKSVGNHKTSCETWQIRDYQFTLANELCQIDGNTSEIWRIFKQRYEIYRTASAVSCKDENSQVRTKTFSYYYTGQVKK